MERLESRAVRPRQARYQAALRPDMKYVKIIKDFPTELLLHLTNFAPNCAKWISLNHRCARIQRRFIGLAVDFLQSFSVHVQLHLRVAFEDPRVPLAK